MARIMSIVGAALLGAATLVVLFERPGAAGEPPVPAGRRGSASLVPTALLLPKNYRGQPISAAVRTVATWVVESADNGSRPFMVIDKIAASVLVFTPDGSLIGAAPALLGSAHGDVSAPGIGTRPLAKIRPEERTTPAGRFVAVLGKNMRGETILWIDYTAAIALHQVVTGNKRDNRLRRLSSATPLDNRITYGCINVPARFYTTVVIPAFTGSGGIVYILPEAGSVREVLRMNVSE
jgi:hypothetical protein